MIKIKLMLTAFLILLLAACGSPSEQADVTLQSATTGDVFNVTVTATPTIQQVVWLIDGETVETDAAAPFELEVQTTAYPAGDHTVRANVSVDILDRVSVVTRDVTFTSQAADDGTPTEPTTPAVLGTPTLLASFAIRHSTGVRYDNVTYRPRSSTVAGYLGWDVLTLPGGVYRSFTYPDWVTLQLNRPATLVVLWNGTRPQSWLSTWTKVKTNVYRKSFPAGKVVLGAIGSLDNQAYRVLFAEQDGTPSRPPAVPSGQTAPKPNQACPAWVHASYTATGPDGKQYLTWHPQIDPTYWCYLGHTHYSDPSLLTEGSSVAFKPAFGYVAAKMGHPETNEGFRGEVLEYRNTSDGHVYRLYKLTHVDTAGGGRVCNPYHTHQLVLYDVNLQQIVANLQHMANFGPARDAHTFTKFAPTACPNNAKISQSVGARNIPLMNDNGYESWQIVYDSYPQLGISGSHTVAYLNPHRNCADSNCNTVARQTPDEVDSRVWVITPNSSKGQGVRFNAATAFNKGGTFYTDAHGMKQLSAGSPGAVQQYIKPGLNVTLVSSPRFFSQDPWRYRFTDTSKTEFTIPPMNLENSLIPR